MEHVQMVVKYFAYITLCCLCVCACACVHVCMLFTWACTPDLLFIAIHSQKFAYGRPGLAYLVAVEFYFFLFPALGIGPSMDMGGDELKTDMDHAI